MTSNLFISFIFGIGFAGWIYSKVQRKTGNNTQTSLIASGLAGLAALIVMLIILSALF